MCVYTLRMPSNVSGCSVRIKRTSVKLLLNAVLSPHPIKKSDYIKTKLSLESGSRKIDWIAASERVS